MVAFMGLSIASVYALYVVATWVFLLFLGLDVPGTVEDVVVTLVTGVGLIFVMFLALWAMAMLSVAHKWAQKKLVEVDARLVPFGQTGTGKYLYGLSKQLGDMVDKPDDPLIVRAAAILYKTLPQTETMITNEQMSQAASTVVGGLAQLLDGVKAADSAEAATASAKTFDELRNALISQELSGG
jgi:hypothetical protein